MTLSPLRILLVQFEQTRWEKGRSYPYPLNFGFEDGLMSNGVEVTMITSVWRTRLAELCHQKRFDQVWFNDLSHFADIGWDIQPLFDMAPLRVGFLTESLSYSEEERAHHPWLSDRDAPVPLYLEGMTHVAAVDEVDVVRVADCYRIPTMWHPVPMPERFVRIPSGEAQFRGGYFGGSVYGERGNWLSNERLSQLLGYQRSTDSRTQIPARYNALQERATSAWVGSPDALWAELYEPYLRALKELRFEAAQNWIADMQRGAAVVNLPHLVKGYSSRVIEGMASGRPVVSWRVPDRPMNQALFAEGQEILLFDTPEELAAHLDRIVAAPGWASRLAAQARQELLRRHTSVRRVYDVLRWIEDGVIPGYRRAD